MTQTQVTLPAFDPVPALCEELSLPARGVAATVALFAEGATVPFIARYRKEVTGGLDEVQIRAIEERRAYLAELHERKQAILQSIAEQGKLSPELQRRILDCRVKAELEDLYLPYKPKRRTRAIIAREKGLGPLAERMLAQPAEGDPLAEAAAFVNTGADAPGGGVPDVEAALAGARDIVAETLSETAEIRALVRDAFFAEGMLCSEAVPEKTTGPTKFEQYYAFREAARDIPSHRFLAIRRGEREEVLRVRIEVDADAIRPRIAAKVGWKKGTPFAAQLDLAISDAFRRLLASAAETDVRVELKLKSDRAAVDVFADNLRNLLLSAPLGTKSVVGIDPGLRTGCKCVAVDATGKFLETMTIYPSQGAAAEERARKELVAFVRRHAPIAVAVGNGTAGRETEDFTKRALAAEGLGPTDGGPFVMAVSESGASVYSASEVARDEFPDLDVTVRGAISIARRLQDPLAELVKIDPKAIGVGQYQHDVHQPLLAKKLEEVVESCVNHVGVELNTASAFLLARVAGIGPSLAKKIVAHREKHGAFKGRQALLGVPGLGPRTFEQAAGFLRVHGGEHPLDASAVHPERYALVERIAGDVGVPLPELVGNARAAASIRIDKYVGDGVGEPTLRDIVAELGKPGRDPRASFEPPKFRDDVMSLADLKPGMTLEGVVTNVTAFGAFVDVGVHQDGLVHVSQLADRFVKDPKDVVKVGDKLTVRVLEVDLPRKRISLTAKKEGAQAPQRGAQAATPRGPQGPRPQGPPAQGERGKPDRKREEPAAGAGPGGKFSNNPFAKLLGR